VDNIKIDPEFRGVCPAMQPDELALLTASIAAEGCRDPLVVWNDHGILLDGHNRYDICTRDGKPYKTTSVDLPSREAAKDWIIKNQLGRRNLSRDQWEYLVGLRYNREKTVGHGKKSGCQNGTQKTAERLGAEYGVSPHTIVRAGQTASWLDSHPKEKEAMLRNREPGQRARKALSEARRSQRVAKLSEISKNNAELNSGLGKFSIIYADPPWRYEFTSSESRSVENQYPTMELDDICKMDVQSICEDNAILFLWTTPPKVSEAVRVVSAWGFEYRTCMVWVKDKIGCGWYVRQKHELLFIATRGKFPTPENSKRPPSVIEAPRLGHSVKPMAFIETIEAMYPDGLRRVELFCRARRQGWAAWGNQAND